MNKITFLTLIVFGISQGAIYEVTDQPDAVVLTTSALKLEIKKSSFQISVFDLNGKLIIGQAGAMDKTGAVVSHASAGTTPVVKRSPARYHAEAEATITGESHKFNCGNATVYITFRNPYVFSVFMHAPSASGDTKETFVSSADEHFWGLGETWSLQALDLKGHTLKMKNASGTPDEGGWIPFYISSRGYGILIDNHLAVQFNFGNTSTTINMPAIAGSADGDGYVNGASTNWYFYYGPDMLDVIDRYTEHVSRPALPPPWSVFSTWQWRDANTESGARSDVQGMQDANIPLSLIWLDRPWAMGDDGMPPPFNWNSDYPNGTKMVSDFNAKGVKVGVWVAENPYIGDRDPKTWMNQSNANKVKGDVTAWLGSNNVQMYKIDRGNVQSFAPYFTIQAFYEAWYSVFEGDFITLPRVVSHYGQKYVSGKWPGDNDNNWGYTAGGLASNIPAMLNLSIAGFPHWGSDTGGFSDVPGNDITVRWAEFSAFCTIFQACSRPHSYDASHKAIYQKYAMLYTSLFPYRWTYTVLASAKGHPTARALSLHHPDDSKVYDQDAEYYFGDWILVAPIVTNVTSRNVYLPEGEWIDWWDGTRRSGKTSINYSAPLDKLPLFMKAGAIIPMIEVTNTQNQNYLNSKMNPLIVRMCPKGNTTFSMAGDKKVYKKQTKPYTNLDPVEFTSSDVENGVTITASGAATTQYQFEVYTDKTFTKVFHNNAELAKSSSAASGWSQETGKPVVVKLPAGAAKNDVYLSVDGTANAVGIAGFPRLMEKFDVRHNQLTGRVDVSFVLGKEVFVTIDVYNISGQKVKSLLRRSAKAGCHNVAFSSTGMPQGNYLVCLKTGKTLLKQKLIVLN